MSEKYKENLPKPQVYFKPLKEDIRENILYQTSELKSRVTLWVKGEKARSFTRVRHYESQDIILVLEKLKVEEELSPKVTVLFNFQVEGIEYFGRGRVEKINPDEIRLQVMETVYSCQRRQFFRLLPFQAKGIKLCFTGLKKNEEESVFFAHDISVSGAALYVPAEDQELFKEGTAFTNLVLDFKGRRYKITESKVVYSEDKLDSKGNCKDFYRIGLEFIKKDKSITDKLFKEIFNIFREKSPYGYFEDVLH